MADWRIRRFGRPMIPVPLTGITMTDRTTGQLYTLLSHPDTFYVLTPTTRAFLFQVFGPLDGPPMAATNATAWLYVSSGVLGFEIRPGVVSGRRVLFGSKFRSQTTDDVHEIRAPAVLLPDSALIFDPNPAL